MTHRFSKYLLKACLHYSPLQLVLELRYFFKLHDKYMIFFNILLNFYNKSFSGETLA